jgi:chaperone BCS1
MTPLVKEGLGISAIGGLLTYLRSIPLYFWNKGKSLISVTVDMPAEILGERNEVVSWLENWLENRDSRIYRNLRATTHWRYDEESDTSEPIFKLIKDVVNMPGWFKFEDKRLLITCHKRESSQNGRIFYDYHITFFTKDIGTATRFLASIREEYVKVKNDKVVSRIFTLGEWKKLKDINPREFTSVILPQGKIEIIKSDIDEFMSRRQLYLDLNINHKRGYLFEGLPGTGKSSIANAIAFYLKWNLYTFNKSDVLNKGSLSKAFSDIKPKSVILLEDIDTYKINRNITNDSTEKNECEDTGDWLNWLDGINSPNDCIFVMTTNYVEKLDPALIRDGRIDFSMNFSYADEYQIRESFKRFHLSATNDQVNEFVNSYKDKKVVMADIQNDLFRLCVPEWRGLTNENLN